MGSQHTSVTFEFLTTLGMDKMEKTLDNYLDNARDKTVIEVLDHLLSEEVKSKRSRRFETKFRYTGSPCRKIIDGFDISSRNPKITL